MRRSAKALAVALAVLCASDAALADNFKYIENGAIRMGVDMSRGGAIGYLSAANNDINIINIADMGREVQMSFYGGPDPYDGCSWSGGPWPWNPIGAGDQHGNTGHILSVGSVPGRPNSIHIITKPLQWACDNVACDCTFERKIWLDEDAVWVEATLHNDRADHTDYGAFDQELPATYTVGTLDTLACYTGGAPFTNAPLQTWPDASGPPWKPGAITCTENWAAFYNPSTTFGMGLFRPDCDRFLTGFAGKHGTGGPNTEGSTGYIAGLGHMDLRWNENFTYKFALVLGNLDTIRSYVYRFKSNVTAGCADYFPQEGGHESASARQPQLQLPLRFPPRASLNASAVLDQRRLDKATPATKP